MKYHIEQRGDEVVISFDQLDGQPQAMIEAIGRCRQSAWACPTGECMKIADMQTCAEGDAVALRLKPRPDTTLSVASLGECLKYQLPREIQT